jgi:hypothetical protein
MLFLRLTPYLHYITIATTTTTAAVVIFNFYVEISPSEITYFTLLSAQNTDLQDTSSFKL